MKEINVNSRIHGFILKETEFVSDIGSQVLIFEHEQTSAKLMYIKNKDTNKTFSIGFKTPPEDNTGVMHILEHSVLCGSRKYPSKEPFVELCKSSLNTFLNAITYSDKTVYPVSSRNEKDFFNLMSVYLDAVFYPNIYSNKKIFEQEGWRYHLEKDSDEIIYNGVVYNEMKGALSSPISQLVRKIEETLYPDNAYAFESGGDPAYIPELTYEQFINTHKKLYHPSNSYITLCGDLDLDKALELINTEYLSNFEKSIVDIEIEKQKAFDKRVREIFKYSVTEESQLQNQDYLALNFTIEDIDNVELSIALNMLTLILVYSEGAPLKQALIDAKICDDVLAHYCGEVLQPYFSIILKGFNRDNEAKFLEIFETVLKDLIENGISKDLIEGCVNIFEFRYREGEDGSEPKGLIYCLDATASWIHGSNPIEKLKFEKYFDSIKKSMNNSYFENIIDKYMLNNNHSSIIILEPELNLCERNDQDIKDRLSKLKESLSQEDIDKMVENTKALIEYQNKEDSPEVLEMIPSLSIDDLDKDVPELKVDEYIFDKTKVYHHDIFTGGISYIEAQFNTKAVPQEDLGYLGLLVNILYKVNTDTSSYIQLSNKIMCNLGGLAINTKEYNSGNDIDDYDTFLNISCKVLVDKTNTALDIINEIATKTNFEDINRIKDLIKEKISEIEMKIMSSGHYVVTGRMSSYFNELGAYQDITSGLEYYTFLKQLEKNIESDADKVKDKLYSIKDLVFNKNNMRVTVVGSKKEKDVLMENMRTLQNNLPCNSLSYNSYTFTTDIKNEAILIPSDVQYVAKGYNFKKLGHEYKGSIEVLEHVLRYGYLWNNIRVKGGAYGALINFTPLGNFMLCSYRDPNVKETIDVYKEMPEFVKNMDISTKELEKAIIGTMSNKQLPLSSKAVGKYAINCTLTGKSQEDRQQIINDILSTSLEDLRGFSNLIKDVLEIDCQAVAGNKKALDYPELFTNTKNVFE